MTKLRHPASLMLCLGLYSAMSGCVSSYSLTPYLDKAVGQRVSDIEYPHLRHQKVMTDTGPTAVIEYSIDSLWRCRWIFEVEKADDVVKAWRYPDRDAAKWCEGLPSTRP
jgi:hypothetical protein